MGDNIDLLVEIMVYTNNNGKYNKLDYEKIILGYTR
jgi:hypothetical protein